MVECGERERETKKVRFKNCSVHIDDVGGLRA